jgi:hypothetical protein
MQFFLRFLQHSLKSILANEGAVDLSRIVQDVARAIFLDLTEAYRLQIVIRL